MITFDTQSYILHLYRRIRLLFRLSPFPILLSLLWFRFYVRHHCISPRRLLKSSATFVRRFLVVSISQIQPAAFAGKVKRLVGPLPSTASVIIQLCHLGTRVNVDSVLWTAILEPAHCPVPGIPVVRVRSPPTRLRIYQLMVTRLLLT
jgi:hypothetical protein